MRYMTKGPDGVFQFFKSQKDDIKYCVFFSCGKIAAKCSTFELAQKSKAKDERLYGLEGMTIAEVIQAP